MQYRCTVYGFLNFFYWTHHWFLNVGEKPFMIDLFYFYSHSVRFSINIVIVNVFIYKQKVAIQLKIFYFVLKSISILHSGKEYNAFGWLMNRNRSVALFSHTLSMKWTFTKELGCRWRVADLRITVRLEPPRTCSSLTANEIESSRNPLPEKHMLP